MPALLLRRLLFRDAIMPALRYAPVAIISPRFARRVCFSYDVEYASCAPLIADDAAIC